MNKSSFNRGIIASNAVESIKINKKLYAVAYIIEDVEFNTMHANYHVGLDLENNLAFVYFAGYTKGDNAHYLKDSRIDNLLDVFAYIQEQWHPKLPVSCEVFPISKNLSKYLPKDMM